MSFHSYMETFAEAWVAANTQTAVNLQLAPRPSDSRNLSVSTLEQHELPTMLNKTQLSSNEPVPLSLTRSPEPMSPRSDVVGGSPLRNNNIHQRTFSNQNSPRHLLPTPSTSGITANQTIADDTTVAIHCLVEPSVMYDGLASLRKKDTFVVLPGFTPFKEVVQAVLLKIGYTNGEAMGAKGSILIKQWEPLSFDTICRDPDATVHQVLGDLTNVATLKIKMFNYCPEQDNVEWNDTAVRCAVNELLKEMNQCKLAKVSPLSQSTISNIANSKYLAKIGLEKSREFGAWYQRFRQNQLSNPESDDVEAGPKDTRLTFHPTYELPKMREWYHACKNPSDQVLRRFLDEINEGHVRQQRPKITLSKLKIWWKNEKQRERRIVEKTKKEWTLSDGSQADTTQREIQSCLNCNYHEDNELNRPVQSTDLSESCDPVLGHT